MHSGPPSAWVRRFASLVTPGAEVLDLAAGAGRHGRLFLAAGHPVTFVDRDVSGLADLSGAPGAPVYGASVLAVDLEGGGPFPLAGRLFGGVVVTNYLHRPLLPAVVAAVGPGGVLLYETFAEGNEALGGRVRNPDFLLAHGELLEAVRGQLRVVAYEDVVDPGSPPAAVQRICAVRPAVA